MFVFDQERCVFGIRRVFVYRDAAHARGRLRKHVPFAFLIGKIDVIRFVVHLEVQVIPPVPYLKKSFLNRSVTLSGAKNPMPECGGVGLSRSSSHVALGNALTFVSPHADMRSFDFMAASRSRSSHSAQDDKLKLTAHS